MSKKRPGQKRPAAAVRRVQELRRSGATQWVDRSRYSRTRKHQGKDMD